MNRIVVSLEIRDEPGVYSSDERDPTKSTRRVVFVAERA